MQMTVGDEPNTKASMHIVKKDVIDKFGVEKATELGETVTEFLNQTILTYPTNNKAIKIKGIVLRLEVEGEELFINKDMSE